MSDSLGTPIHLLPTSCHVCGSPVPNRETATRPDCWHDLTNDEAKMASKVEAVKAHALAHYEDGGWDVIVECFSDEDIADALRMAVEYDVTTPERAIAHFRDGVVAVWADRQADARNSAF